MRGKNLIALQEKHLLTEAIMDLTLVGLDMLSRRLDYADTPVLSIRHYIGEWAAKGIG